jgi:signal peptidase II
LDIKKTSLHWVWLSLAVVILDQLSKHMVLDHLSYQARVYVLPFLNLTLERNKGAAFSFLSQTGNLATWLFICTAIIISVLLVIWLYKLPAQKRWLAISLSLILGGAVGNLIDRISYGYVIDFIHFHIKEWSWPIFNLADTAITIGSLMLLLDVFRRDEDNENTTRQS